MQTRIIIGCILVLLLGAAVTLALHKRVQDPAAYCKTARPAPSIVAFGDSLVYGYGAASGQDFPSVLAGMIGVPIENRGLSGDTTADALVRLKNLNLHPDIVIILLGGNDALRQVPIAETKANLEKIIEMFKTGAKPVQVVLIGVMGGYPTDPFASMFKQIAQEEHVPLVPNILSGIFGDHALMYDEVHPNAAGYAKIAAQLVPVLNAACESYSKSPK